MKIAVRDLLPNPFRHLDRYPIDQAKVDALKASIKATDFWDNIVVRKSPDVEGKFELAYGHHRYQALKDLRWSEVDLPVRNLDDTQMILMMARENMQEMGATAIADQETVRSVVEAFAEGKIKLPSVEPKAGHFRVAPSFLVKTQTDIKSAHACADIYTAGSLKDFLGWTESRVDDTLLVLTAQEDKIVARKDVHNLTTHQAAMLATEARRVRNASQDIDLTRNISKQLADGLRQATTSPGQHGRKRSTNPEAIHNERELKERATELLPKKYRKSRRRAEPKMPDIERFIEQVLTALKSIPSELMQQKLQAIADNREHLTDKQAQTIASAIEGLIDRVAFPGLRGTQVRPALPAPDLAPPDPADDGEVALLKEFAALVLTCKVTVNPKDYSEWKDLLARVEQVLAS